MYTKEEYENAKSIVKECEKHLNLEDVMFRLAEFEKRLKCLENAHANLVETVLPRPRFI